MLRTWFKIALFNFFVAAIIGVLLRYSFVAEVPWLKYRNFLHAHSHVLMLGWIYLSIFLFFVHSFLSEQKQKKKKYRILFWLTQLSVVGMLISFPIQGYAFWSIFFSTLHVLLSYFFTFHFLKDLPNVGKSNYSNRFVRIALLFMLLSSVALWSMGPIMVLGYQGKPIYYLGVQFFLHFQFNGWFLFAVLGLFFKFLEDHKIAYNFRHAKYFFYLLVISCFLSYALAVGLTNQNLFAFAINRVGVLLQLIAFGFFIAFLFPIRKLVLEKLSNLWIRTFAILAFICFGFKVVFQSTLGIPFIAKNIYTIPNFTIGYIHLVLLGIVTCFLLAFAMNEKWLNTNSIITKSGLMVFLSGIIATEFLLFLQGVMFWGRMGHLPFYSELLFSFSLLLPLGILLMFVPQKLT